jgi:hypothetical protein
MARYPSHVIVAHMRSMLDGGQSGARAHVFEQQPASNETAV